MTTRRALLQQILMTPLAFTAADGVPCGAIVEQNCLSQESMKGFSTLPMPNRSVILVCGAGNKAVALAPDLRQRAMNGAWILWETMPQAPQPREVLRAEFGIDIGVPIDPGLYVRYLWPKPALTRSFLQAVPVICHSSEILAQHGETPIAMRRRVGRGGIIFLGSMLGPNLYGEEREAREIAMNLLRSTNTIPL